MTSVGRQQGEHSNSVMGKQVGKSPPNVSHPKADETATEKTTNASELTVTGSVTTKNTSNEKKSTGASFNWGKLNTRDLLPGQVLSSENNGSDDQAKKSRKSSLLSQGRKSTLGLPSTETEKEGDRLSLGPRRDSTFVSLDSVSRRSVDYKIPNTTIPTVNNNEEEKPKSLVYTDDALIRIAIPYLPVGLSVVLLVINILLPGSGTIICGFSIFCCGKSRVPTKDDRVAVTFCVNVWVGVAQFFTIPLFLVGWFWSIAWGIRMVLLAVEHRRELKRQRDLDLQQLALSAFSSPRRSRMPPI